MSAGSDVANLTALINAASQARDMRLKYDVSGGVVTTVISGITITLTASQVGQVRDAYNGKIDTIHEKSALLSTL